MLTKTHPGTATGELPQADLPVNLQNSTAPPPDPEITVPAEINSNNAQKQHKQLQELEAENADLSICSVALSICSVADRMQTYMLCGI
jgi:hypothetical protein